LALLVLAGVALAGSAGPDNGGLVYTDSDEVDGPPHHVLELSDAAEDLALGDEGTASVVLPFELDWYGSTETTLIVGDNGTLFFEGSHGAADATCAPGGDWSGVAVFWEDLETDTVSYEVMGAYPHRVAVFDWAGVHPHGVGGEGHVQAWVLEATGEIVVVLDDLDFGDVRYDDGKGAMIGAQASADAGLDWSCETATGGGRSIWFGDETARPGARVANLGTVEPYWYHPVDNAGFGEVLHSAEFNGDLYTDLVMGAPEEETVYLVYGGPYLASGSTEALDASFVGDRSNRMGSAIGSGDLDGDGLPELVLGEEDNDDVGGNAGAVWILAHDSWLGELDVPVMASVQLTGAASSSTGAALVLPGDVDGDGYGDVVVGAPDEDSNGSGAGAVYLWSGGSLSGIHDLTDGVTWLGASTVHAFGSELDGGDLNGDGLADIVVGAPSANDLGASTGKVYLLAGGSWGGVNDAETSATASWIGAAKSGNFGSSVVVADLDGDGLGDLAAGAYRDDSGTSNAGAVYVFFDAWSWGLDESASGADLAFTGDSSSANVGVSLDAVDVDADGTEDLIIGAPNAASSAGAVYVIASLGSAVSGPAANAGYTLRGGFSTGGAGTGLTGVSDTDGDGYGEVAVGAWLSNILGGTNNGIVNLWRFVPSWDDADGDGLLPTTVGGPDCDDGDAASAPGLVEDTGFDDEGFAVDNDCDGWIDGEIALRTIRAEYEFEADALLGSLTAELFDFEDASSGDLLNTRYSGNGLTLSASGSVIGSINVDASAPIGDVALRVIPGTSNTLQMEFDRTVDGLSFQLLDSGSTLALSAVDEDGNPVLGAEIRVDHQGEDLPGGRFVGLVFRTPILALRLETADRTDSWGLDDLAIGFSDLSDRDGDGYTGVDGDCDDAEPLVNPGEIEVLGDGLDNDCDGTVDGGGAVRYDSDSDWAADANLAPQVVDFEDPAAGTTLTDEYADLGVEFAGDLVVATDVDGSAPSGTQAARATSVTLVIDFEETQPAVAFLLLDGTGSFTARGYDEGTLLYENSWTAGGNDLDGGEFVGFVYDFGVTTLELEGPSFITWGIDDLTFSELGLDDADGDGFTERDGDCDDSDSSTNPDATEVWYDGIDSDCDGASDYDADGDGHDAGAAGSGLDCNDNDSGVSPDAEEIWYDGTDSDCDGLSDYDADGDGHDAGGFTAGAGTDCDDGNAAINPDAEENFYDGVDDNCEPTDDNDADGDGYSSAGYPSGLLGSGDCDDDEPDTNPDAEDTWYDGVDSDCGGEEDYDADQDGYISVVYGGDDCDDSIATVNPGATEDPCYDGLDQDCDGDSDNDCDGDGYDHQDYGGDDCDDDDDTVFPGATDVDSEDGIDQDCDGVDEWDDDLDGYRGVEDGGDDCDDTDSAIHPGAVEVCYDGLDSNCSGHAELDCDEDGYTRSDLGGGDDCDDMDASVYPGASDTCYDGVDSDCALNDDDDCDGDGYAAEEQGGDDCNDAAADISPEATEVWYDGIDANCDGLSDYDADLDGYDHEDFEGADCDDTNSAISPDATETWYDGVDQDCDAHSDFDADFDGFDREEDGGLDCDDADSTVSPAAEETWYDGVDQDCDDHSDDDADFDGFDWDGAGGSDCDDDEFAVNPDATDHPYDGLDSDCDGGSDFDADGDGHDLEFYGGDDCDDQDATVNSEATETWYDGIDQDCNGASDYDADLDGYDSSVYGGDDCDDGDAFVNPAAAEIALDGVDQDCDGVDLLDADGDGHDAVSAGGDDCDDNDAGVHPGVAEIWYDGVDQDCDGWSDFDADLDGQDRLDEGTDCDDTNASVYLGADEIWYDGRDSDCDGASDYDQDADGHDLELWNGDDCDDLDPETHPDVGTDDCGGGDQDCDGTVDEDCPEPADTGGADDTGASTETGEIPDTGGTTDSSAPHDSQDTTETETEGADSGGQDPETGGCSGDGCGGCGGGAPWGGWILALIPIVVRRRGPALPWHHPGP
jgi:hypothetical protein